MFLQNICVEPQGFHSRDHTAIVGGGDERIVLLSGDAGHGLEPMGEAGSAFFDGPVFHGFCNGLCHIQRKVAAAGDA